MKLNFKVFGDSGTPIIILHGLLGSLDNWQSFAKKLSEQFTVYIVDQRNHGKSPHSDHHNYDLMQADLLEFMDDQGIDKANIIGHSMGGKTAMEFTLRHPERVNKLIVADIAPKKYPRGHDEIFKALFEVPVDKIESRNEAEKVMEKYIPQRGVRLFLMKNLDRKGSSNQFEWKMNLEALWKDYDNISSATFEGVFDGPVLFLKGEKSPYIQASDIDQIHKLFPQAIVKTIPNAGHWVHADSPRAFMENVLMFL